MNVNIKAETLEEKCERLNELCGKLNGENFELKGKVEDLRGDKDHFKRLALTILDILKHEIEMER